MIRLRGLLSKILLLVIVVAILSLAASYGFVTAQQSARFEKNVNELKQSHLKATQLILQQQLKEQVLTARELLTLGDIANKAPEEASAYLENIWPRIQLSLALSSMSLASPEHTFKLGEFPQSALNSLNQKVFTSAQAKSAIICHSVCELVSAIPVKEWKGKWVFTLTSDIAPSVEFLYQVVGSDIGVLAPNEEPIEGQYNLKRYITGIMTGVGEMDGLLSAELTLEEIEQVESTGLRQSFEGRDYYIWFEILSSVGSDLQLSLIHI